MIVELGMSECIIVVPFIPTLTVLMLGVVHIRYPFIHCPFHIHRVMEV